MARVNKELLIRQLKNTALGQTKYQKEIDAIDKKITKSTEVTKRIIAEAQKKTNKTLKEINQKYQKFNYYSYRPSIEPSGFSSEIVVEKKEGKRIYKAYKKSEKATSKLRDIRMDILKEFQERKQKLMTSIMLYGVDDKVKQMLEEFYK